MDNRSLRSSKLAVWALAASALLPGALAVGFDCSQVMDDGIHWNLDKLRGPHTVAHDFEEAPNTGTWNITLDICQKLPHEAKEENRSCPTGTYVCATKYLRDEKDKPLGSPHWVAIAGAWTVNTGTHLEVHPTRIKNSGSHSDANREGVRLEMLGGQDPFEQKKGADKPTKQKAIIELLCNSEKTGWEPGTEPSSKVTKRDDGEEEDDKEAIKFLSYKSEDLKGEVWDVLRLEWQTKYACEDEASKPSNGSSHWGFFTWFIIILFLGTSAYVIFGSWLNYNRYGARGWDLLPHSDTIRDIPYIVKDAMRRFQGGGSRGGYSAV